MGTIARRISRAVCLAVCVLAVHPCSAPASASDLKNFTSDGCSLFPDGTPKDRAKWCECCLKHDIAYWRGGTEEQRLKADEALRDCVLDRTGDNVLAETMYLGVRAGGHPVFPAWYRWAYGWSYGRGYQALTVQEQQEVREKLAAYEKGHSGGYCNDRHREERRNLRGEQP